MDKKQESENNFIKKMHPRLYGLLCTLLGIGGLIAVLFEYRQSGSLHLIGVIASPLFILGGLIYLVRGKWMDEERGK